MKKSFLVSLVAISAIMTIIFFGSCADLADSSQALDNSPSVQNAEGNTLTASGSFTVTK